MVTVNKLSIFLAVMLCFELFAQDVNSNKTPAPKLIDPFINNINLEIKKNIEFEFEVEFSNINIGKLNYFIKNEKKFIHTRATLKTNSFYDFIFKIRDELNSRYSKDSLRPEEFNFIKKEGKKESFVNMSFGPEKIYFKEKWKKKKKSGKKEKTYSNEKKEYFDILTMLNRAIFSKGELEKKDYFWLALKSNFYKVVLKDKQSIKVNYKKRKFDAFKYKFSSFKGSKEEKKGDFSIVVLKGDVPVFYELQGHLKIGKIKGTLKNVR